MKVKKNPDMTPRSKAYHDKKKVQEVVPLWKFEQAVADKKNAEQQRATSDKAVNALGNEMSDLKKALRAANDDILKLTNARSEDAKILAEAKRVNYSLLETVAQQSVAIVKLLHEE